MDDETVADPLKDISSVNSCLSKESLRQLDRKLVTFDCQICDMFEEEYFVAIVPQKQDANATPLVYKYFSELSDEQMECYESGTEMRSNPIERGNLLASSLIHMQGWTGPQTAPAGEGMT